MLCQQAKFLLAVLKCLFGNYFVGNVYANALYFRNALLILKGNELPVGPLEFTLLLDGLFDQQFVNSARIFPALICHFLATMKIFGMNDGIKRRS